MPVDELRKPTQAQVPPLATPSGRRAAGQSSYEELTLGVWRVVVLKESYLSMFSFRWENFSSIFPLHRPASLVENTENDKPQPVSDLQEPDDYSLDVFRRGLYDVYTISPRLFVLHAVSHLWSAVEGPLSLYFTNRLFFFIENRLTTGLASGQTPSDLYFVVAGRVACSVFSAYMKWFSRRNGHAYSSRIKYEYQARLFSANLAADLPTSQDSALSNVSVRNVYGCLERGTMMVKDVLSFVLHLPFFADVIGNSLKDGGPVFLALCLLPALIGKFKSADLWSKAYVVSAVNKFYIRKSALEKLVDPGLKQEVMAGGVNKYLMDEYRRAKDGLGGTPDTHPELLYGQTREAISDLVMTLCADAPAVYLAFLVLFNPSKLSIAQLTVLTQTSTSLRSTFDSMCWAMDLWHVELSQLRDVYGALDLKNQMIDGEMPFPSPSHEESAGMGIEVRDVSFSYPGGKSERVALSGISFTIQPGQLVVIVGANGCGKSTIIKLLSRFYDATSGSILIDGIPIQDYRMEELRKGIAMLTQEHRLFPLSVKENIKLGSSEAEAMDDPQKIRESMSAAGAESLVEKFSDGYDTVLKPVKSGYISYAGKGNKELEAIYEKSAKRTDMSGGEKQKLVAARTFMRLFTSPVKLVTVDEPSSALDPEAEYRLFANLRQERRGRTMIFVTHRFGHLTKYADLVICMKEGTVVEIGSHADLLSKGGEYAHLYNIQAQAFAIA